RRRRCHRAASLEHADHALSVAIDAQQSFFLRRAEQIDQTAETIGALVERRARLPQHLLHVAEVHGPAANLRRLGTVRRGTVRRGSRRQPSTCLRWWRFYRRGTVGGFDEQSTLALRDAHE